ncbi:hypothetical protein MKW98_027634 [Papaver atlanticum]|uniref:Uncharacterized protein n=1 Tax=Papaver atlanticum TaxID=357466 RepID=A0AAD4T3X2_9MAGN|nr:hypothetical protein MKW98_027634 [Papaver atlanticum]
MAPSTKKKKAAIKRRKKRALAANIQPSSPTNSQQQEEDEEGDDDLKTHDEKQTTNGHINIETSRNQSHYNDQLAETEKDNKPKFEGSFDSVKTSKEEMAGDKEIGDSESGKVHIEFPKESGKGDSSSSSSSDSSSDDESDVVKKIRSSKKKVLEEFKDGMAGITNAFSGILPSEDAVEKIVSSVEEKIEGASSIAMPSNETEDKTLPASVAPSVDTSYDDGDSSKVPETPESPEKEELLPIALTDDKYKKNAS